MDVLFHPETGLIFWSLISFLLLFVLLKKIAYKPILGMLEKRENKIKESLDEAEKTRLEAEKLFADYQKQIENARKEAQQVIEQGRVAAEGIKKEIIESANKESKRMIESAQHEMTSEKEKIIVELQDKMAGLIIDASSKVVQKALSKKDHLSLIKEYTAKLGDICEG
ncbi:F0F1 ATP synthase subunit B [Candidatus Oleimmundimicrobium sp.]|uniref:F0F1 ATP synthase subunit B n=1 Tax=Candidatus Oleimmundimicrobium sp. TaxID=3060597 RepID=UPI00271EA994|nr:F0F1 ATP synthase subunit B [Candidatus Oleimmundimicrobium sp.]MDO8885470.1 F0F1 ATP synthase subunit B [Candidatus Oleimmundimicrobium sp.]